MNSRPPFISIIIINWNSAAYLPRCLDSISVQTYPNFEVILIDNGSKNSSIVGLEENYSSIVVRTEYLKSNLGFAVANNIGSRLARGQWLALLNADAFPEPNWLESLVKASEIYPNAFFASRQIQANNPMYLDGEGDNYHVSGYAWRNNYGQPDNSDYQFENVFSACGAAALYPRQEFLEAGGFDENYFSYHEDVDLGFRLRLRGLKLCTCPSGNRTPCWFGKHW